MALDLCTKLREFREVEADLGLLGCSVERLRSDSSFLVPYDGNYASVVTLLAITRRLRRILRERRYNVVHSHGWDADILAHWAMNGLEAAHIVHLHVTPSWIYSGATKHRVRRIMTRRMFAASGVEILAVSQAVKDHWGRVFVDAGRTMRVIHNGVDIARFQPTRSRPQASGEGSEPLVLGTAARLAPQKGLVYLLDSMSTVVAKSTKSVRLDIAGEGSQREDLEAKVTALGLREYVRFLGPVSDMPALYGAIDAFVLPAVSDEGLPLVVLEAMASALPVVATDVGGTNEAVRDGKDGRVVPPRDPEALALALLEVLASNSLRKAMGVSARARVCQFFSIETHVENVLSVYHAALAARNRPLRLQKAANPAVNS